RKTKRVLRTPHLPPKQGTTSRRRPQTIQILRLYPCGKNSGLRGCWVHGTGELASCLPPCCTDYQPSLDLPGGTSILPLMGIG
ncbi:Hypothetical predicted protein, partial [Pelobates cultripes]